MNVIENASTSIQLNAFNAVPASTLENSIYGQPNEFLTQRRKINNNNAAQTDMRRASL